MNDSVPLTFSYRRISLDSPTLLAHAAKTSHANDKGSDNGNKDGSRGGAEDESASNMPNFRSNCRVVRLLITRYWADMLIEKYDEILKQKKKTMEEPVAENLN